MLSQNKYNSSSVVRLLLLLFFILCSLFLQAQNNDQTTDTAIQRATDADLDSLREQVIPSDKQGVNEYMQSKKPEYFLKIDLFKHQFDTLKTRRLPDNIVKRMKNDKDFWYINSRHRSNNESDESSLNNGTLSKHREPLVEQKWFQTLLWLIIIGGFSAFIMWYLASSNIGLFRRKNVSITGTADEDVETDDIFAINYQKEIDKAIRSANYRIAIRLMFLRLLRDMSQKNIIQYKQGRTNLDYLMQIGPTSYYKDFFRLTRDYEYSWYGQFEIGEETFSIIQNEFTNFNRQLNRS